MSDAFTFPGDQIATIEEYEAGPNTFDDGDKVRSAVLGTKVVDKKGRIASVSRNTQIPVPEAGDTIVGVVAAVMSSMIAVTIKYINGRPIHSEVECVCSIRNFRRKCIALVNDVMVLKIVRRINGATHATFSEPHLGVIYTLCRKCGDKVIRHRDVVKCRTCGWIDERKLSSDFDNSDFAKLSKQ